MAPEKQTRKELLEEPDPVTVVLHRIAGFFMTYWKPIVSGFAAVLIIVATVSGYLYVQHRAETEASVLFTRGMDHYAAVQNSNGSQEQYQAVKRDFKAILDDYGNTNVADLALVQYASASYRAGDLEEAVAHYEKAISRLPRDHEFREMAVIGLAYAHEEAGDRDKAIQYFEMIAENPDAATRDQALFRLGQLYTDADAPEKSQEAFEKILAAHQDSIYYDLAKTRVEQ